MKNITYFDNFDNLSIDLWRAWHYSEFKYRSVKKHHRKQEGLGFLSHRVSNGSFTPQIVAILLN